MGLLDAIEHARRRFYPEGEPLLAERVIPQPWNAHSGALAAGASVVKAYQDGTDDRHLYNLERVTVVNNSPNCDVEVRPNGDGRRAQVVGRGGGSYVIDSGSIDYLLVKNLSGTAAVAAEEVLISGEAFRKPGA